MTATGAAQLIDLLRKRDPDLVLLAEAASLAARLEPEALRWLRLALLPGTTAGLEADLWFSPLAQSQTPDQLVLRADATRLLRENLVQPQHPIGLAQTWCALRHIHRQAGAAVRLEEQLTFLALAGERRPPERQARLRDHMDRLLRQVVTEMAQDEQRSRHLARWAVSVLPRLPAAVQATESFTLVRIAASLLLDGRPIVEGAAEPAASLEDLSLVLPANLASVKAQVRLTAAGLEVGNLDEAGARPIELPKTNPLFIQATWRAGGEMHSQLLSWPPQGSKAIPAQVSEFELRTAAGDVYTVRAVQPSPRSTTAGTAAPGQAQQAQEPPRPRSDGEPAWSNEQLAGYRAFSFVVRMADSRVEVIESPAGAASAEMPGAISIEEDWLRVLAATPAARRLERMRDIGRALFDICFPGAVRDAFRASREIAHSKGLALRLQLDLSEASRLEPLPWNLLWDPDQKQFLALSAQTPMVRYRSSPVRRTWPPVSPGPLRVLVVSASPRLSGSRDRLGLRADIQAGLSQQDLVIDSLEHATLSSLMNQLDHGNYGALLFVGERARQTQGQEEEVVFETESGQPQWVGVKTLSSYLSRHWATLRLIGLDTIKSKSSDTAETISTLAATLLQSGAALVVTVDRTERGERDGVFWGELLGRAALGAPLDLALTEARKIAYAVPNDEEWTTSALHMQGLEALVVRRLEPAVERVTRPTGPQAAPLEIPVYAIVYDPVIDAGTGQHYSQSVDRDVNALITSFVADLEEGSHGHLHYRVAVREALDESPILENAAQSFAVSAAQSQTPASGQFDYPRLLKQFDIARRVAAGEFDEVWVFAPPGAGLYESRMAGKGAFWCNSPAIEGVNAPRFVVMGFALNRGVGNMLESYGHRAEAILAKAFEKTRSDSNLFKRFTRTDKEAPGQAEVGTLHLAPNSLQDYDWGNTRRVPSRCDNWYRFPDLTGEARAVEAGEWGGGDQRLHHLWWFQHLPAATGEANGLAHDWWGYVAVPERVGRRPGGVLPRRRKAKSDQESHMA
jgi:hypothetical protein